MATLALLGALLLGAGWGIVQDGEVPDQRPPIARHLVDLDGLDSPMGVAVTDDRTVYVAEGVAGRVVRVDADGTRGIVIAGLRGPRDLELDREGRIWVAECWAGRVSLHSPDGERLATLGEGVLFRPRGIELAGELVLVADEGAHRVEVFTTAGEHLFGFGGHGFGAGELVLPADVAVDGEGTIFVCDRGRSSVQRFDAEGQHLGGWGEWGPWPGLFNGPTGIETLGAEVYVADEGNHRVQVFSAGGKWLHRFGLHALRPREGAGMLHYPSALGLSPNGEYAAVAEPLVDRVQLFGRKGGTEEDPVRRRSQGVAKPSAHFGTELALSGPYLAISEPESHSVAIHELSEAEPRRITRVAGLGTRTGLVTEVAGIELERATRELLVCDPTLRRLSVYRLRGSEEDEVGFDPLMTVFVKSFDLARFFALLPAGTLEAVPEPIAVRRDADGRFYLLDRRNACVLVLSPRFEWIRVAGAGELVAPTGLAVAPDGTRIYVCDPGSSAVLVYTDEAGSTRLGSEGTTPDPPLVLPHGVALGADGTAFVTDAATHHLLVFDAEGEFQRSWGGAGLGRGEFLEPRGVALDERGRVFVIDHANHRAQIFTPKGEYVGIFGSRLYTKPARYPDLPEEED